ncbi:MAG: hypothetical protein O2887_01805 [Bacteroidetes bacterium]|nr:hypothetical protein [Bacteroidota bacterium]MDA1119224.1 hypothetical protein [Bacteroidota bacterium]
MSSHSVLTGKVEVKQRFLVFERNDANWLLATSRHCGLTGNLSETNALVGVVGSLCSWSPTSKINGVTGGCMILWRARCLLVEPMPFSTAQHQQRKGIEKRRIRPSK